MLAGGQRCAGRRDAGDCVVDVGTQRDGVGNSGVEKNFPGNRPPRFPVGKGKGVLPGKPAACRRLRALGFYSPKAPKRATGAGEV